MKKHLWLIGAAILFAAIAATPEKKPTVSLYTPQWQGVLRQMDGAKEIMRSSTLPANVVNAYSDSLSMIQMEIVRQVSPQIDSTQNKKK